MRYLSQKEETTCGPVAIYNAIKSIGIQLSAKQDLPWIKKLCKWQDGVHNITTRSYIGTEIQDLDYAINQIGFYCSDTIPGPSITINKVVTHLENNGKMIVCHGFPNDSTRHWIFVPEINKDRIVIINGRYGSNRNKSTMSKKRFMKMIKFSSFITENTISYSCAEFIEPCEEWRINAIQKKVNEFRNSL